MSWMFYAGICIVFFTSLNLLQRKIAVESSDPRVTAVLFNLTAGVLAFILFIITGSIGNFSLPSNIWAWILLLIACFFYGMFERGRFHAAKLLDSSIFNTLINVAVVVTFIASFIFYKDPFSFSKLLGGILIFLSLCIISYSRGKHVVSTKGILLTILISTFLGIGWTLDKFGTNYFNADTYTMFIWCLPIIFIIFPLVKFSVLKNEFKKTSWRIILLGSLNVLGYYFQLKALALAPASIVFPVVQTSILWTVLLEVVLLKERNNLLKKCIAGVLALVGVYFLV